MFHPSTEQNKNANAKWELAEVVDFGTLQMSSVGNNVVELVLLVADRGKEGVEEVGGSKSRLSPGRKWLHFSLSRDKIRTYVTQIFQR